MLFLEQIEFEREVQCFYGQCKFNPECPSGKCMGAQANWLIENLPNPIAPVNVRPGADYGVYV